MKIQKVATNKHKRLFYDFSNELYKDEPLYIKPLYQDIEKIFDPKFNVNFKHGEATRWLVMREGEVVGKIAAFYNETKNEAGMGFFDTIQNKEVAFLLFDTAKNWLNSKGYQKILAPINFGERDTFWGLLTFSNRPVSYLENFHHLYYQEYFDSYGFSKSFAQTTGETNIRNIDFKSLQRSNEVIFQRYGITARHFRFAEIDQFVSYFVTIYNKAWGEREKEKFTPLSEANIEKLFKKMKPILREDLLWFAFNGYEPVGFYLNVLDINQVFKHLDGNLNWWGKLKFLYYKKTINIDKIRGIIFGVVPEYQGKGAYVPLIYEMYRVLQKDPYIRNVELSWIGDFNPKMHALFKNLKSQTVKTHVTYELVLTNDK
jgi:hypothetical protein